MCPLACAEDDSAYVNAMAQFNLEFGIESALWLKRWHPSTWKSLGVKDEELEDWHIVASDLVDGYCPETRKIEDLLTILNLKTLIPRTTNPWPRHRLSSKRMSQR